MSALSAPSGLSTLSATPVAERAAQVRFRRALSLMAMTLVAPGTAQLVAGNRKVGLVAFRTYLGLLAVAFLVLLVVGLDHGMALKMAVNTTMLFWLNLTLIAAAIGWAALFFDAWRIGQPLSYSMGHRRLAIGVNGMLALGVAGILLFSAHIVAVQRDFILATFGDGVASDAHHGRYNVLLMGGDSGAGRWGLRTDSMTVASIDEETGRTVLIGLPRNMSNFPFRKGSVMAEQFPDGFDCDDCMLNGVSTWAQDNTELFPDSDDPGVDATISAIEGITGLRMNYWAMVNLEGFKNLVDAVGGVTLNVRQPIPIGLPGDKVTGEVEAGHRKLDGFETLWYARARQGSDDYSRMARQKCVMSAMLQQVSPASALKNFEGIAKATSDMVKTNLPASEVDTFLDLALKAKDQKVASVSLVPPMIVTAHPDIKLVQRKITEAIDRSEGDAKASQKRRKAAASDTGTDTGAVTGGSVGTLKDGYAANQAEDLAASC
ncbi:LCP family protein [Nocardioides sp.]|uniref:LCP family protein n=1 Tax=Nocardioides sp. TaxID=35761 RepID=UPI00271A2C5A|nr:LCP family protein [Nocardioides sp.]MDO9456957.1 LCP family protein [Nocardioides sp.]